MPDALDVLRTPAAPVSPDAAFASRLRARVERALNPTGGPAVSSILIEPQADTSVQPRRHGVIPYIAVADARRAIDWYVQVLGAELRGEPYVMPDGRIGHSELALAGGVLYLADEAPASHVAAPQTGADASVSLSAEVADVDELVARAVAAGATLERAAADYPYGRNAVLRDPFGHRWIVSSPVNADRVRNGDAGYASLQVVDIERATRFYAAVLGWEYGPAMSEQGRRVTNTTMSQGLWGGNAESGLLLSYTVDDITAAIARVRTAGGEAGEPQSAPWGLSVDCVDVAGAAFALHQPPAGAAQSRAAVTAARQGDIAYVTMYAVEAQPLRAFYAAVFGWDYTAGHGRDAWNVLEPVPMTGMSGGHDRRVNVPVYRVNDIAAAVTRVRELGGTAADPTRQPYGQIAYCADDQGTVFYLSAS